jgi:hypothetical protein
MGSKRPNPPPTKMKKLRILDKRIKFYESRYQMALFCEKFDCLKIHVGDVSETNKLIYESRKKFLIEKIAFLKLKKEQYK